MKTIKLEEGRWFVPKKQTLVKFFYKTIHVKDDEDYTLLYDEVSDEQRKEYFKNFKILKH